MMRIVGERPQDHQKKKKTAFKWSELMDIDADEVTWEDKKVGKKSVFPENAMANLPKKIWETIEDYLQPWDKVRLRTCTKSIMENWWIRPRDDIIYLKWILQMQEEQINHVRTWKEEMEVHDEKLKLEKDQKKEKEEMEREERMPLALDYYIANHGIVPGVGFSSVAHKFKVYKKDLQEEFWRYEEEMREVLQD